MLTSFEEVYNNIFQHTLLDFGDHQEKKVSPELKPLLQKFYQEIKLNPPDLQKLKQALQDIFVFLTSANGRTNANCVTVDIFLSDTADEWRPDISQLPQKFRGVLDESPFCIMP